MCHLCVQIIALKSHTTAPASAAHAPARPHSNLSWRNTTNSTMSAPAKYIIGCDGGTESLRAGVFDLTGEWQSTGRESQGVSPAERGDQKCHLSISSTPTPYYIAGKPLAFASCPYTTQFPHPGWAEQRPADWWQALGTAVRQAVAEAGVSINSIAAISLDTTNCTVVALDDGTLGHTGGAHTSCCFMCLLQCHPVVVNVPCQTRLPTPEHLSICMPSRILPPSSPSLLFPLSRLDSWPAPASSPAVDGHALSRAGSTGAGHRGCGCGGQQRRQGACVCRVDDWQGAVDQAE